MTLARKLVDWYEKVKRPMPWRLSPSPYSCWLSEIMMQQTTYAAVLPYFTRFQERFPTVEALAAAEESAVLKAWEGLGYYARARNLHKAARQIAAAGRWPATVDEWADVPGVGPYTAAALASVLNGAPEPVVDGNVARVFARCWALDDDFHKLPARKRLADRLRAEIAKASVPGDFNQAMMELGALVCTPANPDCAACPLARLCAARKAGAQADYPRKPARKELPVRRGTAVVVQDADGRVLLVENRDGGLLKGLWELPLVETGPGQTQVFSHFRLELDTVRTIRADAQFRRPDEVPLATSTRKILVSCGLLVR